MLHFCHLSFSSDKRWLCSLAGSLVIKLTSKRDEMSVSKREWSPSYDNITTNPFFIDRGWERLQPFCIALKQWQLYFEHIKSALVTDWGSNYHMTVVSHREYNKFISTSITYSNYWQVHWNLLIIYLFDWYPILGPDLPREAEINICVLPVIFSMYDNVIIFKPWLLVLCSRNYNSGMEEIALIPI